MIFSCQIAESRKKDGTLKGIGARWSEARIFREFVLQFFAYVAMFLSFITIAGSWVIASEHGVILALALVGGMAAIVYGLMHAVVHCPGRTRELTFWRDGVVRAPLGLSTVVYENGESKLPHADIVSIEVEQVSEPDKNRALNYTHGVRIFYRTGHVVHVARHIEADDAHQLAVCLTQALAELRASMAHEGRTARSRSVQGVPRRQQAQAVID